MEHLIRFTNAEGRDGHHVAPSLEDALRFVERLRNTEEVAATTVYRLTEVPFEFKTYYKVEVRSGEGAPEEGVSAATPPPPAPPVAAAHVGHGAAAAPPPPVAPVPPAPVTAAGEQAMVDQPKPANVTPLPDPTPEHKPRLFSRA